jgi:2-C-methyl-D-erythritol 4-phosphate cytidylyltransferase/2-C-methyl-D-erythritol 2,4-cyclodiphosphate synthase
MTTTRPKVAALIVAAGRSERAGDGLPKQYRRLCGRPVLAHSAERLIVHPRVSEVRVVMAEADAGLYAEAVAGLGVGPPVIGGASRQESVCRGLEALAESAPDLVLIHDAARPHLPPTVVDRLLDALAVNDGAVPALPVADSLRRGTSHADAEVDRDGLRRVQTPQAFRYPAILDAHRHAMAGATDDAAIGLRQGFRIAFVAGDERLMKLTYAEDFALMEAIMDAARSVRTGMGFDVHRFADGHSLWLCGVEIAHSKTLLGHSDADVALHALTDALLGAIAAGDIGDHFPPSEEKWRGAPSHLFLEHACGLVAARGGSIEHADLTLICEAPRIGPHRPAMRARVAALLRLTPDRVSIKATTTERLGFTGRGEGIAAQAVVTVRL